MLYGFVTEEIEQVDERNPLYLQAQYAKYIEAYCEVNIDKKTIIDEQGKCPPIKDEMVMLRCTCDNVNKSIDIYTELGVALVENKKHIELIEEWYKHIICKRKIIEIKYDKLLDALEEDRQLIKLLNKQKIVFIKSKQKGFSCLVLSSVLLKKEEFFMQFLKQQCNVWRNELLISEYINICEDSLGKRESRHIVMNGRLINSSRLVKSLIHTVPRSHLIAARKKIEKIKLINNFPQNYVLDLGEYMDGDNKDIDIIEINPITTALCFINNSIYTENVNELGIGAEYYHDYLRNPEYYFNKRISNRKYNYITDSFYDFIEGGEENV